MNEHIYKTEPIHKQPKGNSRSPVYGFQLINGHKVEITCDRSPYHMIEAGEQINIVDAMKLGMDWITAVLVAERMGK